MIAGFIDSVDADGCVVGWARDPDSVDPCIVEVLHRGQPVAHAVADRFRRDLFRDGVGHGHYGFRARLRPGIAIDGPLALRTGADGVLNPHDTRHHTAPARPAVPLTVEALLAPDPGWEEGDLLEHTAGLRLPAHLADMGRERFLDVTHHLLLGRWADDAARHDWLERLGRAGAAEELFRALLVSPERRTNGLALAGPFDHRFPYDLALFHDP